MDPMTEQPGPEPTLADVLAEMRAMRAELGEARTDLAHRADRLAAAVGQLRADVAAVKVDTGYLEAHATDQQTAIRQHVDDPNAHRRAA